MLGTYPTTELHTQYKKEDIVREVLSNNHSIHSVIVRISIAMIRHYNQNLLGKDRVHFILYLVIIILEIHSRNSRQELMKWTLSGTVY